MVSKPKPECSVSKRTKSQPASFRRWPMPGVANSTTKCPYFLSRLPQSSLRVVVIPLPPRPPDRPSVPCRVRLVAFRSVPVEVVGAGEMAPHRGLGALPVAMVEPVEDRLVLLQGQELPPRHVHARLLIDREPVEDAPAHGREQRVAGEFRDGRVKLPVERHEVGPARDRRPALVENLAQAGEPVRGPAPPS